MLCRNMDEAHRLSAHVFGVQGMQHLKTNSPKELDGANHSVYAEKAAEFYIKPHATTYREKKDKRSFTDKSLEKMIQRQAYLKKINDQREMVLRYVKDNKIVFSEIEGIVPESTKNIFLQWIATANMNTQKIGLTEYGQEFRLIREKGDCVLRCEDGDLTMPAYVMEFK